MILRRVTRFLLWLATFTLMGSVAIAETGETKPYCIGRFLVNVPVEFELLRQDGAVRALRIERVGPGSEKDLERIVSQRIQALKSGSVVEQQTPQLFRSVEQVGDVKIVSRWDDLSIMGVEPSEPWGEEAFVRSDGVIFRLDGVGTQAKLAYYHQNMSLVAKAIHPRGPGIIPTGEGTCLETSFLALPPGNEQIGAMFVQSDNRAISLRISTAVREPGNGTLDFSVIQGADGHPAKIAGFNGKELRLWDGPINLSAIVGQQATTDRPGYQLTLEYSDGRKDAGSQPDARSAATAIWKNFISSIQLKR